MFEENFGSQSDQDNPAEHLRFALQNRSEFFSDSDGCDAQSERNQGDDRGGGEDVGLQKGERHSDRHGVDTGCDP